MGQLEKPSPADSYETRELAWELQQEFPDQHRIKFLLDSEADLRAAMRLSNLQLKDILKKPALRILRLQKLLEPVLEHLPRESAGL